MLYNTAGVTAGAITLIVLYDSTIFASNLFKPEDTLSDQTQISWGAPFSQRLAQTLYTTQIVLNVALFYLGSNRIGSSVAIGGLTGSLYSSFKLEWLNLEKDSTSYSGKIYYITLLTPSAYDENHRVTCSEGHTAERNTLITHIFEKFQEVVKYTSYESNYRIWVITNEDGRYIRSTYTLELSMNELPSCFSCDERLIHGYLSAERGPISWDGDVLEPKSNFGAALYLTYGIIQLSLILAQQKYHRLAGSIYKIQKVMIGLDILAIAGKIYDYQSMHHAELINEAIVAALAISAIALVYIFYYHRTETGKNQIDHFFKEAIPESDLANLIVNSTTPTSFRIMQWALTSKILLDLALTPDTSDEQIHLISAAIEAFTLLQLSQISWIFFERKYTMPLMNHPFKLFDLGLAEMTDAAHKSFKKSLTEVTTRFHFIVPNKKFCTATN